jgi:carboxyl-terminal processing protease
MKIYCLIIVSIWSIIECHSQENNKYCNRFIATIQIFNKNSISPIQENKVNEEDFRDKIISTLDPNYVLFSHTDILDFESIGKSIKKNLTSSYCDDKDLILKLYIDNLKSSISILDELKNVTFSFNKEDSIYTGQTFNKEIFLREKKSRWISLIKQYVLMDAIETTAKYDSLKQSIWVLDSCLKSTQQKVIEREKKRIKRIIESKSDVEYYVYEAYINSLLVQFDPYSYSFSEDLFRDFKEQLSICTRSFGIQFEINKSGSVIISSIIPGSYAWRTGLINYGDEILKLQTGKNDPLILKDAQIEDIVEYTSTTTNKLIITLSNKSGEQKEITLFQENTEQIENSVQTLILNGEIKVGYILLPSFYTSWDSSNTFGCSHDIGKAIYSLKKENIESLIIDLRSNGGGSITEAIDLAGIFIDFGTLTIGQNSNKELYSIKDFNRGTMYSGPLAILINNNSASASEMVAAILQDYNRAIIVGDTSFGKASGQSLISIDSENKDILKLTTRNYYRVTGKTYSKMGVFPDISLPVINHLGIGRYQNNDVTFSADSVSKKTYYRPLNPLPIEALKNNSYARVTKNDKFQKINRIDNILNSEIFKNEYLHLDLDKYYLFMKANERILEEINSIKSIKSDAYTIDYLKNDQEMIQLYKYYSDLLAQFSESVISDPYIEEVYKILIDYQTLK